MHRICEGAESREIVSGVARQENKASNCESEIKSLSEKIRVLVRVRVKKPERKKKESLVWSVG